MTQTHNRRRHIDSRRILVGVGTSAAAHSAVDVAAEVAEETGRPLHLLRVWRGVDWFLSAPAAQMVQLRAEQVAEQKLVVDEYLRVRELAPNVPATCEFTPGSIYEVLLRESAEAALLVLGTSDPNEPSLANWFLERADCPMLVVRPDATIATSTTPIAQPQRQSAATKVS